MLLIEFTEGDNINGKIICDGKTSTAGCTVVECIDFLFKLYWVFALEYPVGLEMFFKFLQFKIYNIMYGKERIPATVGSVARLFGI